MSITDELREWAVNHRAELNMGQLYPAMIEGIADRIDAAHEHGMEERADRYSELRAKMSNCYVELPVDADGEYIRIGDVLTDDTEFKCEGKVVRLMLEDEGWVVGLGYGGWSTPSLREWHHHHAPTVEDVLTEFGIDWEHEDNCEDRAALLAKYAVKLRLAGDGE